MSKERICIGSSKEAEISDINVERAPNLGTILDFSNKKIGITGIMTADDGTSYPGVPNLSSAYHEVPRHSEARVGLFGFVLKHVSNCYPYLIGILALLGPCHTN